MEARLKEIEERLEKASPGPWDADYAPGTIAVAERISEDEFRPVMIMTGGVEDCKLAACLRNNIEPLLAELEQARRERDEARGFEKDESRRRQKMHAALVRVASSLNYFYAVRIAKNALEEDK